MSGGMTLLKHLLRYFHVIHLHWVHVQFFHLVNCDTCMFAHVGLSVISNCYQKDTTRFYIGKSFMLMLVIDLTKINIDLYVYKQRPRLTCFHDEFWKLWKLLPERLSFLVKDELNPHTTP